VQEAQADYTDAMSEKDPRRQQMLLRQAAWQDKDPLAQAELCRRYSSGGPGLADPIEAYVWCSIASYNTALEGVSAQALQRQYEQVFGTGYAKRSAMYRRLRTAQRTEAHQRINYILSCRGASGLVALGELYHPFMAGNRGNVAQSGSGADYQEDLRLKRIWLQDAGFQYFNGYFNHYFENSKSNDSGFSATKLLGLKSKNTARNGFVPPFPPLGRSASYRGGSDGGDNGASRPNFTPNDIASAFEDGSELPRNAIEALTFYILAERAGHPFARELSDQLERELTASLGNPGDVQVIRKDAEVAADLWMPPFEVYANGAEGRDGRYSDECPVNGQRESALYRMSELDTRDEQHALKWLQFYKGDIDNQSGPGTRGAARDFQLANNWYGNGRLTDYQRSMLIRMAAVAGDTKSQETLGFMYACGIGVAPDEVRASHWYTEAYDQGSALAAYNLGLLYQAENATNSCLGPNKANTSLRKVKPDPNRAERYIRRAVAWGFESVDQAFRRRFDLPQLRFQGSDKSDDEDDEYTER
jgi:TPR repeat protein